MKSLMIKQKFVNFLAKVGSDINLADIAKKFEGEKVLLVGDGISQIYALDKLKNYKYVIAVNQSSPLNKRLVNSQICHLFMEPSISVQMIKAFAFPRPENLWIRSISRRFTSEKLGFLIMHPYGVFFKKFLFPGKKILFCSPYSQVELDDDVVYDDFTAAFQAALGVALTLGFKNIDVVGFDAWLLTPKNTVRWYSNVDNPSDEDVEDKSNPPEFLLKAAQTCTLSTFVYENYLSKYEFVTPIATTKNELAYSPQRHREFFMSEVNYSELCTWENFHYPNGYDGSRT